MARSVYIYGGNRHTPTGGEVRKMMTRHLRREDVPTEIIAKTFPSYKGNSFQVRTQETVLLRNYWDGGSREYPCFLVANGDGLQSLEAPNATNNPFLPDAHAEIHIPKNGMVVIHNIFCGKDMGLKILVSPDSDFLPKMLPADNAALPTDEMIVLYATSSYKNTNGGRTNIRYAESHRQTGITPERWSAAMDSCKAKKLLNASGAITIDGRNAVSGMHSFQGLK